ncbi:hypothetical protein KCU71_g10800, partial [Aureobasidium melanogenum]
MPSSQSYTWRPYNYQPVAPVPPPPMPILLAMPMLVAPCVAVPVKSAPLKDLKVAGSDTAAAGKELVTTTKTTAAVKGTSSKTVTKTVSKAASSAAKAPSKAASAPASSVAKARPSKPASSAPAKSTASKASKKSSSQAAAEKISATVVVSKTVVSASTSASKKSSSAAAASNTSSKTTPSQKAAKLKAVTAPIPPLPGMKYIYPKHHTCLHVILRTKVWESLVPANLVAKTFYVPCVMTITELIEQLMGTEGDKCKGWALTEVQEKGDGVFVKGMSVEYGGDKAALALKGVGWNEKNGAERPPVWMVLHKI